MCDNAVASQGVVLVIDVLNDLTIIDREKPLVDEELIALIEPVPEQCYHGELQGFLILGCLLQRLDLPLIPPCDDAEGDNA